VLENASQGIEGESSAIAHIFPNKVLSSDFVRYDPIARSYQNLGIPSPNSDDALI
jgi:hypothetical protein